MGLKPMTDATANSPTPEPVPVRYWALIPCAGTGSRAGTDGPKQYQPLAGKPMVLHTLAAFAGVARLAEVLVVLAPDDAFFASLEAGSLLTYSGGATRAASVFNGLAVLLQHGATRHDWVLVHDAARCLITPAQIETLIDACSADEIGRAHV